MQIARLRALTSMSSFAGITGNSSSTSSSLLPCLFVVGPTGSGKTRLAVDLALALGGEIINADVIQMYAGLDVTSAKATMEERRGIPHHLFSFLPPRANVTVREFRALATAAIADIHSRGVIPIVAGGTGYYVQALLRDSLLEETEAEATSRSMAAAEGEEEEGCNPIFITEKESSDDDIVDHDESTINNTDAIDGDDTITITATAGLSSKNELHLRLLAVDPIMAKRLHPNDTRRIARALAVHANAGVALSTLLARQATARDGLPGPYRSHVYWLTVDDRKIHDLRLDTRVTDMLKKGLAPEIAALSSTLLEKNENNSATLTPSLPISADIPSNLTQRLVAERTAASITTTTKSSSHTAAIAIATAAAHTTTTPSTSADPPGTYTGVLRAIGFKEFQEFLDIVKNDMTLATTAAETVAMATSTATTTLPSTKNIVVVGKRSRHGHSSSSSTMTTTTPPSLIETACSALTRGISKLRDSTHSYARKQDRWIRNRFLTRGVPLVRLDTSNISISMTWDESISGPVVRDARAWLNGKQGEDGEGDVSASPDLLPFAKGGGGGGG